MTIFGQNGVESNDPKLVTFHNSRDNPIEVRCIKDDPDMYGFGKSLKSGDIVTINGTIHCHLGFCVCVPAECAFYEYDAFELLNHEATLS